jgi:hypothetical protein
VRHPAAPFYRGFRQTLPFDIFNSFSHGSRGTRQAEGMTVSFEKKKQGAACETINK